MIQSSAIFMVVAVSAERYRAVCHPMSKRQAQCPIWRIFHHYFLDIVNKYQQVKLSKFISQHFLKMQFGISANLAFDTLKLMQFELFYLIIHSLLVSHQVAKKIPLGNQTVWILCKHSISDIWPLYLFPT